LIERKKTNEKYV